MVGRLDPNHITWLTYDPEAKAVKVKIQDAEMSMQLSHKDGDSLTSHPAKLTASSLGVKNPEDNEKVLIPAIDCSSLNKVRVDINGTGEIKILVSPNDSGDFFYLIGNADTTYEICARRLKVVSVDANGDVHLVGKG